MRFVFNVAALVGRLKPHLLADQHEKNLVGLLLVLTYPRYIKLSYVDREDSIDLIVKEEKQLTNDNLKATLLEPTEEEERILENFK